MKYQDQWEKELEYLHALIRQSGMEETTKWGTTVYTHLGRNVVSCGGFRDFCSLWFYDGVFLADPDKVLVSATEGKTKALRQWRFTGIAEIDPERVMAYVREAIQNVADGRVWTPQRDEAAPELPEPLHATLEANPALRLAFEGLSPYKQKEYAAFIEAAKRPTTRQSRMDKIIPLIRSGRGLHDQYR